MVGLNKVFLMGNLTRDPELRYTPSGTAVATIGLAVNREYRDKNGEIQKEVCYIDVDVWARQAELCSEHLGKGSPVHVEGRLQYDTWENPEGERRSKHKVRADRVQFLARTSAAGEVHHDYEDESDYGDNHAVGASAKKSSTVDDIPF
ncbi:MAG: single-stranded DNA-binding protein [Candidatus Auribacterota bacterium]